MKTINRNNYEEFFLLYADNELDAETKLAVENFVQQNTDLAIELEMLMQAKAAPEEMIFNDKDLLLRTEGNSINEANYEEYFLLYIDNELSLAKREEVEMYVLQHPRLQNEFTGLKQAVLTPEITSCDKKHLYRTEKKRTVYLRTWRLAAAAIFIGACAVGWWLLQKPVQNITVTVNHSTKNKAKQNLVIKPADTIQQQIKDKQKTVAQQSALAQNKIAEEKAVVKKKNTPAKIRKAEVAEQNSSAQKENTIYNAIKQNNIVKQNNKPVIKNNDVAIEAAPSAKEKTITAPIQVNDNAESNSSTYKVYDIAYKEINTNDDENSLHVGAFDLNKNKVKNLFKKAKRLFENKANANANEDGKLQVANFEIQTKQQ